jgi:hypothetical protein
MDFEDKSEFSWKERVNSIGLFSSTSCRNIIVFFLEDEHEDETLSGGSFFL